MIMVVSSHALALGRVDMLEFDVAMFTNLTLDHLDFDTTISLSSRLRQRPDHYTIRAGRNLPDKEFRYLRTVIVTAAVYWGFN